MSVLFSLLIISCSENEMDSVKLTPKTKAIEAKDWKSQLQSVIDIPPSILKESGITLLGYELVDELDNNVKVAKFKETLKAEENMIPAYSKDLKAIRAITKAEAKNNTSAYQKYTFSKCEQYIENNITEDMKVLRLRWSNNGVETNTLCVVSETKGIIYDNFLTNVFIVKEPKISKEFIATVNGKNDALAPRVKSLNENENFNGALRWIKEGEADWLWGTERGSAKIEHTGYYSNGKFQYHNYSASHYFELGNSDAQVKETSTNTIAYGYAFSTPFITINLSFERSGYSLSFSSMIGSTAGETGAHTHPLRR